MMTPTKMANADTECYQCRITQKFYGGCPKPSEISNNPNFTYEKCICTQTTPPTCMIMDVFNGCPLKNAVYCQCTTGPCTSGGGSTGGDGGDTCEKLPCSACDANDGTWRSNGTGYEIKKTGGTCSGNTCNSNGTCSGETVEYRCATGYCGETTDGKTGCTAFSRSELSTGYCFFQLASGMPCPPNAVSCKAGVSGFMKGSCPSGVTGCTCEYTKPIANTNTVNGYSVSLPSSGQCKITNGPIRLCAAGYYGNPDSGTCQKCPSPGTSDVFGIGTGTNTTIDKCYIPAGTRGSDTSGTFEYTTQCAY